MVILAAGRATRYGGIKPLARVGPAGESIVDYILRDAVRAGFTRVLVVINRLSGPSIIRHIKSLTLPKLQVEYVTQPVPNGTSAALECARPMLGDSHFVVASADDILGHEVFAALLTRLQCAPNHLVAGFALENTTLGKKEINRAILSVDTSTPAQPILLTVTERHRLSPAHPGFVARDELEPALLPPDTLVAMSLWGFKPSIWDHVYRKREPGIERLLTDVAAAALMAGQRFEVLIRPEHPVSITHRSDLTPARKALLGSPVTPVGDPTR